MTTVFAVLVGVVVFALGRLIVARREVARMERRVRSHIQLGPRPTDSAAPPANRIRATLDGAERRLERRIWWGEVVVRLERAGLDRRPVDLLALVLSVTVLLTLPAAATGSAALALLLLFLVPAVGWLGLGLLAQRRIKAFDAQLPDLLAALSSSLRAGHGFLQSLQAVANDAPNPAGVELRRALAETRLGRPVDEALAGVTRRVPSRDFGYILTAIAVQRQVGGSLAGLFETVNDTVRQRQQFTRKVRALTATGRMSAYALVGLPFAVALLLSLFNHAYLAPLAETHGGRLMLLFGITSIAVGTVLVRRVVSFKA